MLYFAYHSIYFNMSNQTIPDLLQASWLVTRLISYVIMNQAKLQFQNFYDH